MNRNKIITEPISFKEYKKIKYEKNIKKKIDNNNDNDIMSLDEIIKFSKDKKNIKSDKKRKAVTKELFLEYLDFKYNNDDEY